MAGVNEERLATCYVSMLTCSLSASSQHSTLYLLPVSPVTWALILRRDCTCLSSESFLPVQNMGSKKNWWTESPSENSGMKVTCRYFNKIYESVVISWLCLSNGRINIHYFLSRLPNYAWMIYFYKWLYYRSVYYFINKFLIRR